MDNMDFAHRFFYNNDPDRYREHGSLSFYGPDFCSYYTLIAHIAEYKEGGHVLLLSQDNFTVTTSKHISHIWSASPYNIIRVPFKYGEHHFNAENIIERLKNNLDYYSKQPLTRKENREAFKNAFNSLEKLKAVKGFKIGRIPERFKKLYNQLNDPEELKKRAAAARAKQAALNKKLASIKSISKQARLAYSTDSTLPAEQRAKLRRMLNPDGTLAFIWRDKNGDIETSKGIHMAADIAAAAWERYKNKQLKHGDSVGPYTVLNITGDRVKIGCHLMLIKNLLEVFKNE